MTRYFCFRFDVDTHRCVRRGVPNLIELGSRIDAPFTFFVNMGRAVSRTRLLRGRGGSSPTRVAAKLPTRVKLGAWDSLVAAVLNPPVGTGSPHILRAAIDAGHEVGLHGGANHAEWQAEAHRWTADRVRDQVALARAALEAVIGHEPAGFASPGWNSPDPLPSILQQLGFRYMADLHGPATEPKEGEAGGGEVVTSVPGADRLVSVRTAITAEPGGVAYLENLRARGLDAPAIRADFRDRLQQAGRLAVVYDHPYFAGIQELELVAEMVELARDMGFRPVRLAHAVDALSDSSGESTSTSGEAC